MANSDVLPRHGFVQMAYNVRCQLYFPFPTEQVVLLRTGVLVHINAYMHSLGLTPPEDPVRPTAESLLTHANGHAAAAATSPAGASFLKSQVATNGSAGVRDSRLKPGSGSADAMGVDSGGEWLTCHVCMGCNFSVVHG